MMYDGFSIVLKSRNFFEHIFGSIATNLAMLICPSFKSASPK
jgi:hypothetical protein